MNRRTFLTATGTLAAGTAGCLDGQSDPADDSSPTATDRRTSETQGSAGSNGDPDDGYPPESAIGATPEERSVDASAFERLSVGDVQVPLVPVDVAHYWYQRRNARFVDARGTRQYDRSHVEGAVSSPARRVANWPESREDDPTADWPTDDRIVTYCGCPHHLSSLRAGEFRTAGYERVYAIDEGYGAWLDRGYPATGADASVASYVIRGRTDPADAGGYAWATDGTGDQREAAPIDADGGYELTLKFGDVGESTPIRLRTPSYEVTAPLSELTAGLVTGPA